MVFARHVPAVLAAHPRIVLHPRGVLDNWRVENCPGYCLDALPGQDAPWEIWRCDQKSARPEWIHRQGSFELRLPGFPVQTGGFRI